MKKNSLILCLVFLGLYFSDLSLALRPEEVQSGHVWLFEDGKATDSTKNNLTGVFVGNPKAAKGVRGNALLFNGQNDGIRLPDSSHINTGGPWTNRTIRVLFNCS
ncbi:hypothetical protein FJZ33_10390, partial [Candidatus Poribacteria bacterium]|nr:hypothetical protein [Candidatus Poribacteria bacterium]